MLYAVVIYCKYLMFYPVYIAFICDTNKRINHCVLFSKQVVT